MAKKIISIIIIFVFIIQSTVTYALSQEAYAQNHLRSRSARGSIGKEITGAMHEANNAAANGTGESRFIEKPLLKIPESEIKNIFVLLSQDGPVPMNEELEETTILLWPLVTALRKKYPDATIYLASNPQEVFTARQFRGKVKQLSLNDFNDLFRNKEKRERFLADNNIGLIIDLSSRMHHQFYSSRDFLTGERPYIVNALSPMAQIAPVYPNLQNPGIIYFYDRQGKEYEVSGIESVFPKIADPILVANTSSDAGGTRTDWRLKKAGVWMFPIEIYQLLGLDTTIEDLPTMRLSMAESVNALDWMRRLFEETNTDGSLGAFDPNKKIVIVNTYANDIFKSKLIKKEEWADIILDLVRDLDDAYIVLSCGHRDERVVNFFYQDMHEVMSLVETEIRRQGLNTKSKVLFPKTKDAKQRIDRVMGISSNVLALDAGFSHLANGVYGIPVFSITGEGFLHMLPPRDNAQTIELPVGAFPVDIVEAIASIRAQKAVSAEDAKSKLESLRAGIRKFIATVNSQPERLEARKAKLSALSLDERKNLDFALLTNSFLQVDVDNKDLESFIDRCYAAISDDPSQLPRPEIRYVDTARQRGFDFASYKAKLFTPEVGKTFLYIDRSALAEKDGKFVVNDDDKGFWILHEITGHVWARYLFDDFARMHPKDKSKYSEEAINIMRAEEEIVAWLMTFMAVDRLIASDPSLITGRARQRIQNIEAEFVKKTGIRAYCQGIIEYVAHGIDDPSAGRYIEMLRGNNRARIESDIYDKYLPTLAQVFGEEEQPDKIAGAMHQAKGETESAFYGFNAEIALKRASFPYIMESFEEGLFVDPLVENPEPVVVKKIYEKNYYLPKSIVDKIRTAEISDLDGIKRLSAMLWGSERNVDSREYTEILSGNRQGKHIWVYRDDHGFVRGYLYASFNKNDKQVDVEEIVVDGESRGQGIGKALMAIMLERMQEIGAKNYSIFTISQYSARIAAYFGFKKEQSVKKSLVENAAMKFLGIKKDEPKTSEPLILAYSPGMAGDILALRLIADIANVIKEGKNMSIVLTYKTDEERRNISEMIKTLDYGAKEKIIIRPFDMAKAFLFDKKQGGCDVRYFRKDKEEKIPGAEDNIIPNFDRGMVTGEFEIEFKRQIEVLIKA